MLTRKHEISLAYSCAAFISVEAFILILALKKQELKYKKLLDVTKYLVNVIEENDIRLTEFDVIALHELGVVFKEK